MYTLEVEGITKKKPVSILGDTLSPRAEAAAARDEDEQVFVRYLPPDVNVEEELPAGGSLTGC